MSHLRREMAYIALADRQAARLKACQPHPLTGSEFIPGTPSRALLSILGVLRRPATRADHLSAQLLSGVSQVYSGYVRRAAVVHGTSYYVAATREDLAAQAPVSGCLALDDAALHRLLPSIPAALRAPTLKLESEIVAYSRHIFAHGPQDTICLGTHSGGSGGQECGITAAAISRGVGPSDDRGTFSSAVPDGVASVTLRIHRGDGPTVSVTAPVRGNIYVVHVAHQGNNPRIAIVWRSRAGAVIKTFAQPNAAALARYCRRHIACAALEAGISAGSTV